MGFLVIYRSAAGVESFERCVSVEAAIEVVERLRNREGISDASIYQLAEVPFEFRPYYRVEMGAAPTAAAPPVQPSPHPVMEPGLVERSAEVHGGAAVIPLLPEASEVEEESVDLVRLAALEMGDEEPPAEPPSQRTPVFGRRGPLGVSSLDLRGDGRVGEVETSEQPDDLDDLDDLDEIDEIEARSSRGAALGDAGPFWTPRGDEPPTSRRGLFGRS